MASKETKKHLTLFNAEFPDKRDGETFDLFPSLPAELRLRIWEAALCRYRLLSLELYPNDIANPGPQTETEEEPKEKYTIVVYGPKINSKLLSVCSESRQAALGFHRIHLPCHHVASQNIGQTSRPKAGILYLNPEWDILQIAPDRWDSFAYLLHDMKTLDPQSKGLLNVAFRGGHVAMLSTLDISNQSSKMVRSSFIDTLSNLQQVFFISAASTGRVYTGPNTSNAVSRERGWEFHRARPIFSEIASFDRLEKDPRPIDLDLTRVFVGPSEPRKTVFQWLKLLDSWGIQESGEYRFLLTCFNDRMNPTNEFGKGRILDRDGASRWVEEEDRRWIESQRLATERLQKRLENPTRINGEAIIIPDNNYYAPSRVPLESTEELEAAPQPAIGFWSFPIEVLGELPDRSMEFLAADFGTDGGRHKRVLDMSEYWPELFLSYIP